MSHYGLSAIRRRMLTVVTTFGLGSLAACAANTPAEACLPEPQAACTPAFNPDFNSIHSNLLAPRCGTAGNNCHGASGKKGNLVLSEPEQAYNALLGRDGTAQRVLPSDPNCSSLMQRLESDDPVQRMPFGESKLPDGVRCAVRMWIEAGANR